MLYNITSYITGNDVDISNNNKGCVLDKLPALCRTKPLNADL